MFVKIYNLIKRQFTNPGQTDTAGNYIPYFKGGDGLGYDNFPIQLSELVDNSPTATACLSTVADFITGEGFNDAELEKRKVDYNGTTFFQLHQYAATSISRFSGFAFLVRYNKAGQITEIINLPFAYCRLGTPDHAGNIATIVYNPYFGTGYYKAVENVTYPVYNPATAPLQIAKDLSFKGQILWYGSISTRSPFYPVPDYFSSKDWMAVEHQAGIYFRENLENGYLQPQMMKILADPNDASGVKRGNSDEEYTKEEVLDMALTETFAGAKRVGKIWVFWGSNQDEFPKIEAFPSNNNGEMYRTQDEHAIKKITIATKVPGVLANINDTNNFSGEQIRPAVALMQQRVARQQNTLLVKYQDMLSHMNDPYTETVTIVPYNPFPEAETMDSQVWAELSTEERRKWIQDHTEVVLIDDAAPVVDTQPAAITNLAFKSYPEKAGANVKKAMDWLEKMDVKCGGKAGRDMADRILRGENLNAREIKRLSTYLSKNVIHKDKPFDKSCAAVEYNLWGGDDMMKWANEKVKEIYG